MGRRGASWRSLAHPASSGLKRSCLGTIPMREKKASANSTLLSTAHLAHPCPRHLSGKKGLPDPEKNGLGARNLAVMCGTHGLTKHDGNGSET